MSNLQRLNKKFYQQDTFTLAQQLLGKYLFRKNHGKILGGKIVEVEIYYGPNDKASHASKGLTPRTKLMFDQAGLAYIYLIYGLYYCLNIVTEKKNFPAAILIRAIEPSHGLKQLAKNRNKTCHTEHSRSATSLTSNKIALPAHRSVSEDGSKVKGNPMTKLLTNGPAKLCQALNITKNLNAENLITSQRLYLAGNPQEKISSQQIKKAKRIGVDYAGADKNKPWRYYLKNNLFVSQK